MKTTSGSVLEYLSLVEDPRVQGRCSHKLIDILAIAICGRISGCESFEEMEEFGIQRQEWLSGFLELKNGIPSHDTIRRVFSLLDPGVMEVAFKLWVEEFCESKSRGRISLDGKCVNGTFRGFNEPGRPLTMVNVYDHDRGVCLAHEQSPTTGNAEITSALEMLPWLNLKGALVSTDAGIAKKSLLEALVKQKADYVVPVKANVKCSYEELMGLMKGRNRRLDQSYASEERNRGRLEHRECVVREDLVKSLSERFKENYPGVETIIEIIRRRGVQDTRYYIQQKASDGTIKYTPNENRNGVRETSETIYYVSSRAMTPRQALEEIRTHWGIENKLHWSLDVIFSEDDCRVRDYTIAQNLATIRKIAFNLMKVGPGKGSKNRKMKRACWSLDYLEELLWLARA